MVNPCVSCGACCASFRVSFYWAERDDGGGTVPAALTEQVTPFLAAMMGTNQPCPRCVALDGVVGGAVTCAIYEARSTTCREFRAAWVDGAPSSDCDAARARCGLPPVRPEDVIALPAPEEVVVPVWALGATVRPRRAPA